MKTIISMILAATFSGICMGAEEKAKDQPATIAQAEKLIGAGVQLLDVRTQEEWDEGHLEGAKRIPWGEDGFAAKVKAALDSEKPVLVYCRSGGRSSKAVQALRDAGFAKVHDMAGGITAWEEQGKPVKKK